MITSIIIHYKRKENIPKVIAGIRNQTVASKIIVIDQSGDYPKGSGEDVLITSSKNFYCQPRFLLQGLVQTEYVYHQDDDLAINDELIFEKFLEVSKRYSDFVIGWNGRRASGIKNWEKAYSYPEGGWVDSMPIEDDSSIDMINVGVSFWRTELINQVPINPFNEITEEEMKYGDDIWISHWLKKKRVMPFKLVEHYDWLNEYQERGTALSKQPKHMDIRNRLVKRFFQKEKV